MDGQEAEMELVVYYPPSTEVNGNGQEAKVYYHQLKLIGVVKVYYHQL